MSGPVRSEVTAAGVLAAGALLFLLATPMCDTTIGENYGTEERRRVYVDEVGPWAAAPVLAAAWVNRSGRDALVGRLEVLEEPFATRQYWKLYPIWGDAFRYLEISVDGRLVHRTNDREHRWMAPQLRERRVGYALDAGLKGNGAMIDPLVGWLLARARADFPDAREVELTWREGYFPGTDTAPSKVITASAPAWTVQVRGW